MTVLNKTLLGSGDSVETASRYQVDFKPLSSRCLMRICLYSPYLPKHTGGGERYLFDVARCLRSRHRVQVAFTGTDWQENEIRQRYQQFLGYSLEGIEVISTPLFSRASWWRKLWWTKQFDLLYYLTDGSLFWSLAGRNILHIQLPLKLDKSGWIDRFKLSRWHVKTTNSEFTKEVVTASWPVEINYVHPPAIELPASLPGNKQQIILHVGRFFRQLHTKRQDVLVEMFSRLKQQHSRLTQGWKLVLIGPVENRDYARQVAQLARGLPVEVHHDVTRAQLEQWYRRASLYWHATGYQVDERSHPQLVEHFGITTLEAMAYGCVPVVINKGGQREIMAGRLSQLLWTDPAQAIELTAQLIREPKLKQEMTNLARRRASQYSLKSFASTLELMVSRPDD